MKKTIASDNVVTFLLFTIAILSFFGGLSAPLNSQQKAILNIFSIVCVAAAVSTYCIERKNNRKIKKPLIGLVRNQPDAQYLLTAYQMYVHKCNKYCYSIGENIIGDRLKMVVEFVKDETNFKNYRYEKNSLIFMLSKKNFLPWDDVLMLFGIKISELHQSLKNEKIDCYRAKQEAKNALIAFVRSEYAIEWNGHKIPEDIYAEITKKVFRSFNECNKRAS